MKKKSVGTVDNKGLLIHISHYDPQWCERKQEEEAFDPDTAKRIVETMVEEGMNLLVVDCADGVRYSSHPELKRHYTAPMTALRRVADFSHNHGIDVVPKLNFSKSGRNRHDQWMAPHANERSWLSGLDEYWRVADELIAELVRNCRPRQFFHVGMDEDHYRSLPQYVNAIKVLRGLVAKHGLKTVIWNDSCHHRIECTAQVHAEKSRNAEPFLPKDIVHVLWDYGKSHPAIVRRIARQGFSVWGAPGKTPRQVNNWRKAIIGNGGNGLLMTNWIKCCKRNEKALLDMIRELAPSYA